MLGSPSLSALACEPCAAAGGDGAGLPDLFDLSLCSVLEVPGVLSPVLFRFAGVEELLPRAELVWLEVDVAALEGASLLSIGSVVTRISGRGRGSGMSLAPSRLALR